jgi:predicted ribosome-associated RNA-binding protein Tma20
MPKMNGTLLRATHGVAATQLALSWLEIKPQGGRIFVDEGGVAIAYRGEDLIYMGIVGFTL